MRNYTFTRIVAVTILGVLPVGRAFSEPVPSSITQGTTASTPREIPLSHLYSHFLAYLSYLDGKADALDAQGKDGSGLRGDLQKRAGLSAKDFAILRAASIRLQKQVKELDAQAVASMATGKSVAGDAQLHGLTAQRRRDVDATVTSITEEMSPEGRKDFEVFLKQFFAPKQVMASVGSVSASAGHKEAK